MARKPLPPEVKARNLTENTTGVYRLPVELKELVEQEAFSRDVKPAAIVREALASHLREIGYSLSPEALRACGVE